LEFELEISLEWKYAMMEDVKIRLGTQLENARRQRHWTLNDVARRIGRQPGRISEIEGGKANSTLHSLSEAGEALGLSLIFVPEEKLPDVLRIIGIAEPTVRPGFDVPSAYDDVFIPDDMNTAVEENAGGRP
jgi:transcriptional regulator with XRE-family HTH domain